MVQLRPRAKGSSEKTSQRPQDTPFKQQRMRAWEPVLTPKSSVKIFLLLGCIFLALGGFWLAQNDHIREIRLDYTRCHEIESYDQLEVMPPDNVDKKFKASSAGQPVDQWKRSNQSLTFDGVTKNYTLCTMEFFLPEDLQPPILYYYRLGNFHQNHREYVNSRHTRQLKGDASSLAAIKSSECGPLKTQGSIEDGTERIIYPCGMVANSYFNDTFFNPLRLPTASGSNQTRAYNMTRAGISHPIDRTLYRTSAYAVPSEVGVNNTGTVVPPPGWAERFPNGYHSGNMFDPSADESFMVWMRTSAGSEFSKLAMRNDQDVMERGMYRLQMFSHYPIHKNLGTKSIIISTSSVVGRRNEFIGRGCAALGALSMVAGFLSAITLRYRPRKLADHDYLHRSSVLLRNRSQSL